MLQLSENRAGLRCRYCACSVAVQISINKQVLMAGPQVVGLFALCHLCLPVCWLRNSPGEVEIQYTSLVMFA